MLLEVDQDLDRGHPQSAEDIGQGGIETDRVGHATFPGVTSQRRPAIGTSSSRAVVTNT